MAEAGIRSLLQTAARYLVSGGAATLLHWGTMAALIAAGLSANLATALGALAGATLNYVLQFHFTFRSRQQHATTMPRYLGITFLSWCSNNAVFALIHGLTGLAAAPSQFLTTALVTVLNFFLYRRFVFNEPHHVPSP